MASRPAANSSISKGLATPDAVDQAEIGRGQQSDIIGILPVNPLEALGDDKANPGHFLGQRAVLARGPLAVACPRHCDTEATRPHTRPPRTAIGRRTSPRYRRGRPSRSSKYTSEGSGVISSVDTSLRNSPGPTSCPPSCAVTAAGSADRKRMRPGNPTALTRRPKAATLTRAFYPRSSPRSPPRSAWPRGRSPRCARRHVGAGGARSAARHSSTPAARAIRQSPGWGQFPRNCGVLS